MSNINKIRYNNEDYDINTDSLPIGTIVEYDGTIVPDGYEEVTEEILSASGTHTGFTAWASYKLASITLPKGKYIIKGRWIGSNVVNVSGNLEIPNVTLQYYKGNTDFNLMHEACGFIELTEEKEIGLCLMLTSNTSGSITGTIQAIKISD